MTSSDQDPLLRFLQSQVEPKPTLRMTSLERAVAQLTARRSRAETSAARVRSGTAHWSDYQLAVHPLAEENLTQAVPSLGVRRARRRAGLPRGVVSGIRGGYLDDALELLAHHPDETVPAELVAQHEVWVDVVDGHRGSLPHGGPGLGWYYKAEAAQALMIVGDETGESRRRQLWSSGVIEDRADEMCDPQAWHNDTALDWNDFETRLATHPQTTWTPPETGTITITTYAAITRLLETLPPPDDSP